MNKEFWRKYFIPTFSGAFIAGILFLSIMFGIVCWLEYKTTPSKNNVVAEVFPAKNTSSSFEEYFSETPTSSEFNSKNFVDDLRAKKMELETYLNSTNLNGSERLAIVNALSNLELAIGNIEIAINEVS